MGTHVRAQVAEVPVWIHVIQREDQVNQRLARAGVCARKRVSRSTWAQRGWLHVKQAHRSAARRATRTSRPAMRRCWTPPAAAGARRGPACERRGMQPKGSPASQHRTSCSMLADSFLSTPASLPAALAGGEHAPESASARRRSHEAWAPAHKNFLLKILAPPFDSS